MNLSKKLSIFQQELYYLKNHYYSELISGFGVFVIALPVSIAIAIASGFPAASGLITAIIGGIVIGIFSNAILAIKGPSISMIPILFLAVGNLSVFPETGIKYTLATIVLAGVIQVLIGLLRLGTRFVIISDTVVYGLIAALGIMVFIKEIHLLFGVEPLGKNILALILEIPNSIFFMIHPNVAIFGVISLVILLIPSLDEFDRFLPRIFLVSLLGVLAMIYVHPQSSFFQNQALSYPKELSRVFIFPDFSLIQTSTSIFYALTIALVGILESMVNIKSIEALDRKIPQSSTNWEIITLGVGNILCGLLGGLPMVVTMENSLANINYNSKSRWPELIQGFYILLFTVFGLILLSYIPIVTLTTIIIYITYKFNSPKLFRSIREIGLDQIVIFLSTIIFTLILGILPGLIAGIMITFGIYLILGSPVKNLFRTSVSVYRKGSLKSKINIQGAALASNYLQIKKHLNEALDTERIIIDLSGAKVVDHSFLELMYYFARSNRLDDGKMEIQGLKYHLPVSRHPLATLRLPKKNKSIYKVDLDELDERQIDLRAVAAVNNTQLRTNLTYDGVVFEDFSFARGYEIRYRENQFMKFYKSSCLEFSDLFLSKGIRISEQSFKMSVLLITVLEVPIPDFTLTSEDLMHKLLQSVGYEDIDFEEYPTFSEKYLLHGENLAAIHSFFSPTLIALLDKKHELHLSIESKSNRLAVYQSRGLMGKTDLEDILEFVEGFLDIIHEEEESWELEAE
ncbi:MAG: SulP family inorganic anion transporter [Microscillaceae bacterium]|nr:SulP family inorganic anion transporter [Microscillaceae bacterium]